MMHVEIMRPTLIIECGFDAVLCMICREMGDECISLMQVFLIDVLPDCEYTGERLVQIVSLSSLSGCLI